MRNTRGFSLIELLAVIAVIALLATLALPAVNSIMSGSNLNRAGQMIGDQVSLARQEAVSKNRDVQVVFYKLTNGPTSGWRGVKVLRVDQTPNGPITNAVTRMMQIPEGIVISEGTSLSPLLSAGSVGTTNLPSFGNVQFASFRFRSNGALDSAINSANSFLTLQSVNAQGNPPANYYTIQVDALTGKVSVYRP